MPKLTFSRCTTFDYDYVVCNETSLSFCHGSQTIGFTGKKRLAHVHPPRIIHKFTARFLPTLPLSLLHPFHTHPFHANRWMPSPNNFTSPRKIFLLATESINSCIKTCRELQARFDSLADTTPRLSLDEHVYSSLSFCSGV